MDAEVDVMHIIGCDPVPIARDRDARGFFSDLPSAVPDDEAAEHHRFPSIVTTLDAVAVDDRSVRADNGQGPRMRTG